MNISSVLVSTRPERAKSVECDLHTLAGVEVHAVTEEGRLIVTIEAESDRAVADTFEEINRQPGVLAVSMVYHQFESDPDREV
jgi:nitrate reductase NapD